MSTYSDASLIFYPSGYEAGILECLKPTTGTGNLTFTRASTATRVNESGLIESVASDVPRIDYTSGCGKLLLEPQRANLILHSQDFTNAVWTKISATISANSTTSPSGAVNASTLVSTVGVSEQYVDIGSLSVTSGSSYTLSAFVKKKDYDFFLLRFTGVGGAFVASNAFFNINNGTLGTIDAGIVATITSYGDGWYRCTAKINASATTASGKVRLQLASSDNSALVVGNGTSGSFIWGADFEAGSYPTSYIPTTTTAVTRVADKSSTTGLGSIIGQTEGTIYVEGIAATINADLVGINRSTTNAIFITKSNLNSFRVYVYAGGVNLTFSDPNVNTDFYKLAITYKSGNSYLYVNGVKIGATNTSTFTFSAPLNILELAGNYFVGVNEQKIQGLIIFPTAQSEAAVAALTTI